MFMRSTFALVWLLIAAVTASASPDAQTDSLRSQLDSRLEEAVQLSDLRGTYTGEDSLVVVLQIENEIAALTESMANLAAHLVSSGQAPPPDPDVERQFRLILSELREAVGRIEERLATSRARAFVAPPEFRDRADREVAGRERRLSRVQGFVRSAIRSLELIGADVADERAALVTDLERRADMLVGRLLLMSEERDQVREMLRARPGDAELTAELDRISRRGRVYVEALRFCETTLADMGAATTEYRNAIIRYTGDLTRSIFDFDVLGALLRDAWNRAMQWLRANGSVLLVKAFVFSVILALSISVSRLVRRATERALTGPRVRVTHLLRKTLITASEKVVVAAGFAVALSQVGMNLAPIFAGVGVIGFIVGFALQETLANFASGIMILAYRPYDVGDMVEVSGAFGRVEKMSLVSTTILTIDNQTLVVPNGKIWGDVIRNVTAQQIRRVDLVFGISYSDDIPKAEKILMSILEAHEKVLEDPEPMVKVSKLNESSVDFIVRPWVRTADYWDVHWDVTREVKLRFDAEDITIPFPQRDVHLRGGAPENS